MMAKMQNLIYELPPADPEDIRQLGRYSYRMALNTCLLGITTARALVAGDVVDENHQLPTIERLILEALAVA